MKKLLLIGWILAVVLMIFGCSDTQTEQKGTQAEKSASTDLVKRVKQLEKEGIHPELASVVDHFKKEGLAVDDIHPKAYEMIGAVGGIGMTVEGGGGVELYLFNPATADPVVAASLSNARESGLFLDPNINREIPVAVNENIMLLGLSLGRYNHPAKDRIIESFGRF